VSRGSRLSDGSSVAPPKVWVGCAKQVAPSRVWLTPISSSSGGLSILLHGVARNQVACRLRKRAAALDLPEQRDLARSHGTFGTEFDPEANAWVSYFRPGEIGTNFH
jgi:hypothetical protein